MAKNSKVNSVEKFYDENSKQWSAKRSAPWEGWDIFWDEIKSKFADKKKLNVLDFGCGNGRLLEFYRDNFIGKINYLGIDISLKLVNIARKKYQHTKNAKLEFIKEDLTQIAKIKEILAERKTKYDIINLIAVIHHFPNQKSRLAILNLAKEYLSEEGIIIYTTWGFMEDEKTRKLVVKELGSGDYFLSWGMKIEAKNIVIRQRFVHDFTEAEKQELIEKSDLKLIKDFRADGKNGKLNHYFILSTNEKH